MRVEHSIGIDAPPDVVWRVTTEIERWPEWNPAVTAASREGTEPFGLGSVARIRQPAQPLAEWVVTDFKKGQGFTWESRRRGIHFVGTHEISPHGSISQNLLRVEVSGILGLLLWPILKPAVQYALSRENQGLKKKAEQLARSRKGAFQPT